MLGDDPDTISEGQKGIGSSKTKASPVGRCHDTLRPKLLFDQESDVLAAQTALYLLAHNRGNLVDAPIAVYCPQQLVQQWWELKDLSVRPAYERRRLFESRALVLADQLDARPERRWPVIVREPGREVPLFRDHHGSDLTTTATRAIALSTMTGRNTHR